MDPPLLFTMKAENIAMQVSTSAKTEARTSHRLELIFAALAFICAAAAYHMLPLWRVGVPGDLSRVFQAFFAGTAASFFVRWAFPRFARPFQAILTPFLCAWSFGPANGLLLCVAPLLWMAVLALFSSRAVRFVLLALLLVGLYVWRSSGWNPAPAWWLVGFWLKFLAMAVDWRPVGRDSWLEGILYWYAPPFFFSPIPLEWLTFRAYQEAESDSATLLVSGSRYILYGIALAAFDFVLRGHVEPFRSMIWNVSRLDATESEGLFHLYAGWCFFFLRFLQYGSFTAVSVGCFHLLGRKLRYDFHYPLLSRNLWDFWARYHNYGREFLVRNVFFPISLRLSEKFHWRVSATIGLAAVFVQVSVVQYMAIVAIPGVEFKTTFPLQGVLNHTFWSFAFLGISYFSDRGLVRLTERLPRLTSAIGLVRIAATQVLVSWLFYNSYVQLWSNRSNETFLRAILSF